MVEFPPLTPQQFDALTAFLLRTSVGPAEQVAMQSLQGWLKVARANYDQQQAAQAETPDQQTKIEAETPHQE